MDVATFHVCPPFKPLSNSLALWCTTACVRACVRAQVVGGYAPEYVTELPVSDQAAIAKLRDAGQAAAERHMHGTAGADTGGAGGADGAGESLSPSAAAPPHLLRVSSILLTQYDPGTFADDIRRYNGATFDRVIGRTMFETTGVPSNWISACELVDELWVPSAWGAARLHDAGIPKSKIFVVPQAVDVTVFDPGVVTHKHELLPGSEKVYSFLSIFKWESRKNYEALLTAFLVAFDGDTTVGLYIRSDKSANRVIEYTRMLVGRHQIRAPPKIVWVPQVAASDLPHLYATADCFVLPTHGEGWGRPIMEAMAMGKPTVATYWGGSTAFLNDDNAFLLHPTGLENAFENEPQLINFDEQGAHQWAKVSTQDLVKLMKYIKDPSNRHIVLEVGKMARKQMVQRFSREAVADLVGGWARGRVWTEPMRLCSYAVLCMKH